MGNSRFSDGFLVGALIGGAVVFLLGTKKGNKVLKVISEEGIEGLTRFVDETSEHIDDYIEEKEEDVQESKEVHKAEHNHQEKELVTEETPVPTGVVVEAKTSEEKTKPHRFFKRGKKATN